MSRTVTNGHSEAHMKGISTKAVHVGQDPDPSFGDVIPPIHLSSTFAQSAPGEHQGFDYSRAGNPTRARYEACLAALENGDHAFAFASGLAASDAVIRTLQPGDHVLCSYDVYGGTFRLFERILKNQNIEFSFTDLTDFAALEHAVQSNTRFIWIETPTNPLLKIVDIRTTAEFAKSRSIKLAVDNTFATPVFQRPLELGAAVVIHSVTKYLNGHSDIIGGAVICNDAELAEQVGFIQFAAGAVQAPFDCYLAHRGIKTLAVRMQCHQASALQIAEFLEGHAKVETVLYPGLPSHPQHELASAQMDGYSGMLSFYLKGDLDDATQVLKDTRLFSLAESLGGVESLIEHPAIMTHASLSAEVRESLGIADSLIRLSVGIEDVDDLIEDLDRALG
ncbi:MAG: cystathionine gamma-synthase [Lysobacterales bacterium]